MPRDLGEGYQRAVVKATLRRISIDGKSHDAVLAVVGEVVERDFRKTAGSEYDERFHEWRDAAVRIAFPHRRVKREGRWYNGFASGIPSMKNLGNPSDLISVIVPVYRSELTLPELDRRLGAALRGLALRHETIYVDDGSTDASWRVLQEIQRSRPDEVIAIQLMSNYGQHCALMCGLRHSTGDIAVTLDDDLQTSPEQIARLIAPIREGDYDLVYGSGDKRSGWLRRLVSFAIDRMYRRAFSHPVPLSSFRAIRRELVDAIRGMQTPFLYLDAVLAANTRRVCWIPVAREPGLRASGYSWRKLRVLAFSILTSLAVNPARAGIYLGAVVSLGFLALAIGGSRGLAVRLMAPSLLAIGILVALQLVVLGILGEYIGRIYRGGGAALQYSVRQIVPARGPGPAGN